MLHFLRNLWRDDCGQDVTEFTLLLAFVVLCSAALLYSGGENIEAIWGVTNNNLNVAGERAVTGS